MSEFLREREGDFVWMEEMRKREMMTGCGLGWERA